MTTPEPVHIHYAQKVQGRRGSSKTPAGYVILCGAPASAMIDIAKQVTCPDCLRILAEKVSAK